MASFQNSKPSFLVARFEASFVGSIVARISPVNDRPATARSAAPASVV
jgi:hypothetical protein